MSDRNGTVAVTLKRSDVLVLTDADGRQLATIVMNDKQIASRSMLVVTADRSIFIHRRKAEPKGIA